MKPKGIDSFIFSSDLTEKKVKIEIDKFGHSIDLKGKLTGEEKEEKPIETPKGMFSKYFDNKYYENGNYTYIEWDGCFDHIYEYKSLPINEVYHQLISD